MDEPRLLICGFGPFPGAPRNPCASVVRALAAEAWTPPGARTDFLTLPTAWDGAADLVLARLADARADGVLILGLAQSAGAFRVERRARNRVRIDRLDQAGAAPPAISILKGGPRLRPVRAPFEAVVAALRAEGLPAALSDDAGDYVCNATLYRLLGETALAVAFLHVPRVREYDPEAAFGLGDVVRAARAAACALAASLTGPAAGPRTA